MVCRRSFALTFEAFVRHVLDQIEIT